MSWLLFVNLGLFINLNRFFILNNLLLHYISRLLILKVVDDLDPAPTGTFLAVKNWAGLLHFLSVGFLRGIVIHYYTRLSRLSDVFRKGNFHDLLVIWTLLESRTILRCKIVLNIGLISLCLILFILCLILLVFWKVAIGLFTLVFYCLKCLKSWLSSTCRI